MYFTDKLKNLEQKETHDEVLVEKMMTHGDFLKIILEIQNQTSEENLQTQKVLHKLVEDFYQKYTFKYKTTLLMSFFLFFYIPQQFQIFADEGDFTVNLTILVIQTSMISNLIILKLIQMYNGATQYQSFALNLNDLLLVISFCFYFFQRKDCLDLPITP